MRALAEARFSWAQLEGIRGDNDSAWDSASDRDFGVEASDSGESLILDDEDGEEVPTVTVGPAVVPKAAPADSTRSFKVRKAEANPTQEAEAAKGGKKWCRGHGTYHPIASFPVKGNNCSEIARIYDRLYQQQRTTPTAADTTAALARKAPHERSSKDAPIKIIATSGVRTHDVTSTADLKSAPFDLSGIVAEEDSNPRSTAERSVS